MRNKIILTILFSCFTILLVAQGVSNIRFEQVGKQIHIFYDLQGEGNYNVSVYCSDDGGNIWGNKLVSVKGNVGKDQKSGSSKMIIWDVLTERKNLESNIIFKIKAIFDNIKTADYYFNNKKYDQAHDSYNSMLLLDSTNVYAKQKIKQIQEIKNLLTKRSATIFSYKNINKEDYLLFRSNLVNDINSRINNYDEGFLNFIFKIYFDTIGTNISSSNIINTSIEDYEFYLSRIAKNGFLKPSIENGYYLASKENIIINLNWKTHNILFKSTSKGIFQSDNSIVKVSNIEKYITNQNFKYGKFTFEIKNKVVNGSTFSDVKLTKYKLAGPESALFSMLMPGMGTLKVTYGKKGWGRLTCFLLSSGFAIGSKLYSDAQFKRYLEATDQAVIDKYYYNANISHHIALIFGSISASIYLYDIIWVFSKGLKNLNGSKLIRKRLKDGSIIIQNQPINLQ